MDLLAQTVFNAFTTALGSRTANNVTHDTVTSVDLGSSTGVSSIYTHTPVSGTGSAPLEPSSACLVVQNRIAARYRGGHPRTFWPAIDSNNMVDEAHWNSVQVTGYVTAVTTFISTVVSASYTGGATLLQHVIPRYTYTITNDPVHHKYLRERTGLLSVDTVQSYVGNTIIGSQRRRLRP